VVPKKGGQVWIFIAAFATVLGVLGTAYAVLRTSSPPPSATPTSPEVRQFNLVLHAVQVGEETMHHWLPAVLVVNRGDTIILKITNGDTQNPHGFALGGFNVAIQTISPGKTEVVRFRATRPGIYYYGCDLTGCSPDHADQTGQLVVLESR